MFFDRIDADDFALTVEKNLEKQHNHAKYQCQRRIAGVISHLNEAANLLNHAGFEKEAECAKIIAKKVEDPAIPESYEKAVQNLLDHGWEFNLVPPKKHDSHEACGPEHMAMDSGDKEGVEGMFENMDEDDRREMLRRLNDKYR